MRLSQEIRAAVDDLERAEKDTRYRVNMGAWHAPVKTSDDVEPVCNVCLAGARLAFGPDATPDQYLNPASIGEFNRDMQNLMYALDNVRGGCVRTALVDVGVDEDAAESACLEAFGCRVPYVPPPEYGEDPEGFKRAVREIADELGRVGY